jgi:hypothetical protein
MMKRYLYSRLLFSSPTCDYRVIYIMTTKKEDLWTISARTNHQSLGVCFMMVVSLCLEHVMYVRNSIKMVEDAINNDKPLYCIGFYFPDISDIKVDLKFTKPVYFSYARFQQADFKATEFQQQADF